MITNLKPRPGFHYTDIQNDAVTLLDDPHKTDVMLYGGSRSGKSFVICAWEVKRAIAYPGSSHGIFRSRKVHLGPVIRQTMPQVLMLRWPSLASSWNSADFNKTEGVWTLPAVSIGIRNKHDGARSQIVMAGLDDKQRTDKVLGAEYSSLWLNECSTIPYSARNTVRTRLAERSGAPLMAAYDMNPPPEGHWTEKMFVRKLEPKAKTPLKNPERYAALLMNPDDNLENLGPGYLDTLEALPYAERQRFRYGKFIAQVDGALWTFDQLESVQVAPKLMGDLERVVVAVDPSGASGPEDYRSDEIGIVVVGVCQYKGQRTGVVLEDCTIRAAPEVWARTALNAYDRWKADVILGEKNFGGDMVRAVIQGQRREANVDLVNASRGKVVRAEPISALYAAGRVIHSTGSTANLGDLEDQLCNFSQSGYKGSSSPDRADAAIWGLTELMIDKVSTYDLSNLG